MLPDIPPGAPGIVEVLTLIALAALTPHVLTAATEIVPPLDPVVTFIEVFVELPDQPLGNDQLYDVAPDTEDIL